VLLLEKVDTLLGVLETVLLGVKIEKLKCMLLVLYDMEFEEVLRVGIGEVLLFNKVKVLDCVLLIDEVDELDGKLLVHILIPYVLLVESIGISLFE
jgi:hypothetical protein